MIINLQTNSDFFFDRYLKEKKIRVSENLS